MKKNFLKFNRYYIAFSAVLPKKTAYKIAAALAK